MLDRGSSRTFSKVPHSSFHWDHNAIPRTPRGLQDCSSLVYPVISE